MRWRSASRWSAVSSVTRSFEGMARAYVVACPPASPIMLLYGESFPGLRGELRASGKRALSVRMWRGSRWPEGGHITRPMPRLSSRARSQLLRAERLADLRFEFHPSVSIIKSPYPIVSIWKVNNDPDHAVPIAPLGARSSAGGAAVCATSRSRAWRPAWRSSCCGSCTMEP